MDESIRRARELICEARHFVAFTGAGLSTASGIPDFRSKGTGLWERDDPMQVASLTTFRRHPKRFWDWMGGLMRQSWDAQPNPAHLALAQLEQVGRLKATITQNIDGLHQKAGSSAVIELHGAIHTLVCPGCGKKYPTERFRPVIESGQDMPRCLDCGLALKPEVTLFEEMLPQAAWAAAEDHCARADLLLAAGTSLEVWPAASLPELALENGARMILVNLTPTPLDRRAELAIRGNVAEVLPLFTVA